MYVYIYATDAFQKEYSRYFVYFFIIFLVIFRNQNKYNFNIFMLPFFYISYLVLLVNQPSTFYLRSCAYPGVS